MTKQVQALAKALVSLCSCLWCLTELIKFFGVRTDFDSWDFNFYLFVQNLLVRHATTNLPPISCIYIDSFPHIFITTTGTNSILWASINGNEAKLIRVIHILNFTLCSCSFKRCLLWRRLLVPAVLRNAMPRAMNPPRVESKFLHKLCMSILSVVVLRTFSIFHNSRIMD